LYREKAQAEGIAFHEVRPSEEMLADAGLTIADFATLIGKSPYALIDSAITPYLEETYEDFCGAECGPCRHIELCVRRPHRRRKARRSHGDTAFVAARILLGRGPSIPLRSALAAPVSAIRLLVTRPIRRCFRALPPSFTMAASARLGRPCGQERRSSSARCLPTRPTTPNACRGWVSERGSTTNASRPGGPLLRLTDLSRISGSQAAPPRKIVAMLSAA